MHLLTSLSYAPCPVLTIIWSTSLASRLSLLCTSTVPLKASHSFSGRTLVLRPPHSFSVSQRVLLLVRDRPILEIQCRRSIVVPPEIQRFGIACLRYTALLHKAWDLLNHRAVIAEGARIAWAVLTFRPWDHGFIDFGANEKTSTAKGCCVA